MQLENPSQDEPKLLKRNDRSILIQSSMISNGDKLQRYIDIVGDQSCLSTNLQQQNFFLQNNDEDGKNYIINPTNKYKMMFDMGALVFISYDLFDIPLQIAFQSEIQQTIFQIVLQYIITSYYFLDIVLNFNTGFYQDGRYISEYKQIATNYTQKWFPFDILATFPISDIVMASSSSQLNDSQKTIFKILKLLRIIRLVRIFKLKKIFKLIQDVIQDHFLLNSVVSFCKLFFQIIFLAHWISCLFNLIPNLEGKQTNWLINKGIQDQSWGIRYLSGLYWSLVTMITIGYGDIVPITSNELIFGITAIILGCIVFGYSLNQISKIFNDIEDQDILLTNQIKNVENYLDFNNINNKLKIKIKRYLEFLYFQKNEYPDQQEIFQSLSKTLKDELISVINLKIIEKWDLNKNIFSQSFLALLIMQFQEKKFSPNEIIIQEQYQNKQNLKIQEQNLFYLINGAISRYSIRCKVSIQQFQKKQNGFLVGLFEFLTNQQAEISLISIDFCIGLILERNKFDQFIQNPKFDKDQQRYQLVKEELQFNKCYKIIDLKCITCNSYNHNEVQCPKQHYQPNNCALILNQYMKRIKYNQDFKRKNKKQNQKKSIHGKANKFVVYSILKKPVIVRLDSQIDTSVLSDSNLQNFTILNENSKIKEKILYENKISQMIQVQEIDCDILYRYSEYKQQQNLDQIFQSKSFVWRHEVLQLGTKINQFNEIQETLTQRNFQTIQTEYEKEEQQLLQTEKQKDTIRYNQFYDQLNTKRITYDVKEQIKEESQRQKIEIIENQQIDFRTIEKKSE